MPEQNDSDESKSCGNTDFVRRWGGKGAAGWGWGTSDDFLLFVLKDPQKLRGTFKCNLVSFII